MGRPAYSGFLIGYFDPTPGHGYLDAKLTFLNHSLIPSNGDAQMWLHLCSLANPSPVHVLTPKLGNSGLDVQRIQDDSGKLSIQLGSMVVAGIYPPGTPVGNEQGGVDPDLRAGNEWPWCVDTTDPLATPAWLASHAGLPACPSSVLSQVAACRLQSPSCFGNDGANAWAIRGAVNAGLSVFLYVQSLENAGPSPDYDQCSLLK